MLCMPWALPRWAWKPTPTVAAWKKSLRLQNADLQTEYNLFEWDLARPKVKIDYFHGKEAHLKFREREHQHRLRPDPRQEHSPGLPAACVCRSGSRTADPILRGCLSGQGRDGGLPFLVRPGEHQAAVLKHGNRLLTPSRLWLGRLGHWQLAPRPPWRVLAH